MADNGFEAQIKEPVFTKALVALMNNVQNGKVDWNLVQKVLLQFTDDVLAVYAETQRHSAECLRQYKQQLQEGLQHALEFRIFNLIHSCGYYMAENKGDKRNLHEAIKTAISEGLEHG